MLLESARSLVAKLAALHAQLGDAAASQGQDADAPDDKGETEIVLPSSPISMLSADMRSRLDRYGVLQATTPNAGI